MFLEAHHRIEEWAEYAVGWFGPKGAPRMAAEYRAVFGSPGHDPEWPDDVRRTEEALAELGRRDKRKLKAIKLRYLGNRSYRDIERTLRIRNGDGRSFVDQAVRVVADILFLDGGHDTC